MSMPSIHKNVCASNPCIREAACHPTDATPKGYYCICGDGRKPLGDGSCTSITVNEEPNAKSLPAVTGTFDHWTEHHKGVIFLAVCGILLIIGLVFLLWRWKRFLPWYSKFRHRIKPPDVVFYNLPESPAVPNMNFASNPNYYVKPPGTSPLHELIIMDETQIELGDILGEGCFGKVYKGEYSLRCQMHLHDDGDEELPPKGSITVAVKVPKEEDTGEMADEMLSEASVMAGFKHENILTLIGIVVKDNGMLRWMIFEYMSNGDLIGLLRSCRKKTDVNDSTRSLRELKGVDLLKFSIQISNGMRYLSSQSFVHRDLACRNCLVDENYTVKISDFGMSRDIYGCDYYKTYGLRKLPIRWMAPESLKYGKFTLESDVWSFGVVLWEIYTFGLIPFYGMGNDEVIEGIKDGLLLVPPKGCPPKVRKVMIQCWATDLKDRINFNDILDQLVDASLELGEEKEASSAGPAVIYSEVSVGKDEGLPDLDGDLYLLPKNTEPIEYLNMPFLG